VSTFTPSGSAGSIQEVTGSVGISGATSPLISNVSLALANTEIGIVLPSNCKKVELKLRDKKVLQISYTSGQSGTVYKTLWPGCVLTVDGIDASGVTIYVQSPSASQVVELETWT